jgi:hypothetical protein
MEAGTIQPTEGEIYEEIEGLLEDGGDDVDDAGDEDDEDDC